MLLEPSSKSCLLLIKILREVYHSLVSLSSTKVVKKDTVMRLIQEVFCNGGFIHPTPPKVSVIIEDDPEKDSPDLVVHRVICQNWTIVDVLSIIHISK